jgi:hypothetical protein
MDDSDARRKEIADWFRLQAYADPFYGVLLEAAADQVEAGGPAWRPVAGIADQPVLDNPALRLMGAAHRAALAGDAPAYAAHLPTCGGDGDAAAAVAPFLDLCASGALDDGIVAQVQTNECARATTLLPGFSAVAERTGRPLRLLEFGASAGLLLQLDRYHHELGGRTWGDAASPVRLACDGTAPIAPFEIAARAGCDPHPLDPEADRLLLLSFVWPTDVARFRRADAALRLAAEHPVAVEASGAAAFLARELAEPTPGVATVVYESIVWQYVPEAEQAEVRRLLAEAGARATEGAPLAWLRLEPHVRPDVGAELRLTTWPGPTDAPEEEVLAVAGYHGQWIRWSADEPAPA